MKALLAAAAPFIVGLVAVGIEWWLQVGWVAAVTVSGFFAVATLAVVILSKMNARRRYEETTPRRPSAPKTGSSIDE
jgi:hypothetical protein